MDDADRARGLIDIAKLEKWMDARGLPGSGEPLEARFISGGASNEIFLLKRGEQRMALRRNVACLGSSPVRKETSRPTATRGSRRRSSPE